MNPITFNDKFAVAIGTYPAGKLSQQFKGWQSAPLFDYETNWDKELTLLQEPTSLADIEDLQWPFAMLRLAMVERDVAGQGGRCWHVHEGLHVALFGRQAQRWHDGFADLVA
jgi:hypothetical protein